MGLQLYEIHSVSSGRQPGLLCGPYLTSRLRRPPAGDLLLTNPPACPFTPPSSSSSLTSLLAGRVMSGGVRVAPPAADPCFLLRRRVAAVLWAPGPPGHPGQDGVSPPGVPGSSGPPQLPSLLARRSYSRPGGNQRPNHVVSTGGTAAAAAAAAAASSRAFQVWPAGHNLGSSRIAGERGGGKPRIHIYISVRLRRVWGFSNASGRPLAFRSPPRVNIESMGLRRTSRGHRSLGCPATSPGSSPPTTRPPARLKQ